MKKSLITIFAAVALLFGQTGLSAQSYQTGFFLENNPFGFRNNPVLHSNRSFLSLATGTLNVGLGSNVGINNLLYTSGDHLVLGLNGAIPSETFLGGLPDITNLGVDLDWNIFAMGVKRQHSYTTLELNLRGDADFSLPKDLFSFLKTGSRETPFDLSTFGLSAHMFAEAALGYSYKLGGLEFGIRAKALIGLASARAILNKATLAVNGSELAYDIDARLEGAASFLSLDSEKNPRMDFSSLSPSGMGFAVDLGVSYTLFDHLTISAAVLDLGGITWNYNVAASTGGADSFTGITAGLETEGIKEDFNVMLDNLKKLADIDLSNVEDSSYEALPAVYNVGLKYKVHGFEALSLGALATVKTGKTGWYDLRAGAAFTAGGLLSLCGNVGTSTFGSVCGAALSLRLLTLTLNLGADAYLGDLASIMTVPVPLGSFRYMLNFGFCMSF